MLETRGPEPPWAALSHALQEMPWSVAMTTGPLPDLGIRAGVHWFDWTLVRHPSSHCS